MTHPIPPGTRDVLPDEMGELRALTGRMRDAFTGAGYGEIHTPALEYEDVLRRGDASAAGARYRTFDEQGDALRRRRAAAALLLLRARLARRRPRRGRAA